MANDRKKEFFDVVFKDEETARITAAMAPGELSSYLGERGYSYSADEIKEYGTELQKQLEQYKSEELSETSLDNVAGGGRYMDAFVGGVGVGVLIGIAIMGW